MDYPAYPRQPFAQHLEQQRARVYKGDNLGWHQGDHIMIVGPTSAGKTTLASKLLPLRSHVVMLVTKMRDPTFEREYKGWTRLNSWPRKGPPQWENRVLLWPKPGKTLAETKGIQREVFADALDRIARQGNRTVCVDETLYMGDPKYLNLGNEIGMLHYFGRSSGVSMVTLTQRPAWIPKIIYSSVTHAYVARTKDRDDAKRLADLGGTDAKELAANLETLTDKHDYCYVNPQGDAPGVILNTRR